MQPYRNHLLLLGLLGWQLALLASFGWWQTLHLRKEVIIPPLAQVHAGGLILGGAINLPSTLNINKGVSSSFPLSIDTGGSNLIGAEIILHYPTDLITLTTTGISDDLCQKHQALLNKNTLTITCTFKPSSEHNQLVTLATIGYSGNQSGSAFLQVDPLSTLTSHTGSNIARPGQSSFLTVH